jgi:hypothetical protein
VAEVVLSAQIAKATAEFAALADRPTTIESFAVSGGAMKGPWLSRMSADVESREAKAISLSSELSIRGEKK